MPTEEEIRQHFRQQVADATPMPTMSEDQARMYFRENNQQIGARESENIPQTIVRGLLETPKTVAAIPSGLLSIAQDTGNAIVNPIDSVQDGTTERALRATGGLSGAVAGGGIGLKAGAGLGTMILPGIGTAVGGGLGTIIGGGLGALGFRKLLQVTGSDEPTSLKKDVNDLVYDTTQGVALGTLAKTGQNVARTVRGSGRLLRAKKAIQKLAEADKKAPELPSSITPIDDEIGRLSTASEMTGNKALTRAEHNIKMLIPEFMDDADNLRISDRKSIIENRFNPKQLDEQVTGELIRKGVNEVKGQRRAIASSLYDDVSQIKDIDLQQTTFADDILGVMDELDNTPSSAPSAIKRAGAISDDVAQFQEELFDLASSGEPVSLSDLNSLQSEAQSMAFRLKNEGGKSYAVANRLASTLKNTMDNLPDGSTAKVARNTYRQYKKTFDESFGKDVTKTNQFGTEAVESSKLPKKALSSPEKIDNFMEIAKDSPIAKNALKDHIVENFASKLESVKTPAGGDKIITWWKSNRSRYGKILDKDDMTFMDRIVNDSKLAKEKYKSVQANSASFSPTKKFENYDDYLKNVIGGSTADFLKKKSGLARVMAYSLGGLLGFDSGVANAFIFGTVGAKGVDMISDTLSKVARGRQKLILDALQDPKVYNEVMSAKELADILPQGSGVAASQIGQGEIENEQENNTKDNSSYKGLLNVPRESGTKGQSRKKADNTPITDDVLDAVRWVESRDGKFLESPAGAKGPYQFMPATAKAYNVDPTDDNWEDDRAGARALLTDEYKALGSIELALASYNLGRPRLLRAIKKAGSKDWNTVSKLLPKETREYVPKIKKRLKEQKVSVA